MEKLIVLGTGNASVTKCYNTCSIIQDEKGKYFMIDAGGGNGILTQLEKMNIPVLCSTNHVVYDVKGILPKEKIDARL